MASQPTDMQTAEHRLRALALRTLIIVGATLGVFVAAPVVLTGVPLDREFLSLALPAGAMSAVLGWALIHVLPQCVPSFHLTLQNAIKATAIWSGGTGCLFLIWMLMVSNC